MSDINYVLIGKRIREIRNQMNLSQAALAEMSGLSTRYISHIETARKKASLSSLVNIANAVGISIDELLYRRILETVPEELREQLASKMEQLDLSSDIPETLDPEAFAKALQRVDDEITALSDMTALDNPMAFG